MDDQEPSIRQILLKDVPDDLIHRAGREIAEYSVSLMAVTSRGTKDSYQLLGSATLIQYRDSFAFLSAAHVFKQAAYRDCTHVGIIYRNSIHGKTIYKELLEQVVTLYSDEPGVGPDIIVVKMPRVDAGNIGAVKSFWNIERFADVIKVGQVTPQDGAWVVAGTPGERVESVQPPPGYVASSIVRQYGYFSGIKSVCEVHGHDYYGWPVSYREGNDAPESFGGFSGGGLWCVQLQQVGGGPIEHLRPLLMGTAFKQTELVDGERVVVCHGPKTLYQHVLPELLKLPQ